MIAVDDGIAQGNLNAADIFFLVAAILAVLGALGHAGVDAFVKYAAALVAVALALTAFGFFLL